MIPLELLPFALAILLFWLLLIRPQQKRQKEVQRLHASLAVGQRVMLTSGIFGTLLEVGDERVQIEVAQGVVLEVMRAAVASVATEDVVDPTYEGAEGTPGVEQP